MRILREYLLREITALFFLSLVIITVLFMSQRVIQITEWAINRGIGVADMARLLGYLLPTLLLIIIPVVTLFSILLAVGRLSADQEIIAMKSSGISLYRLFVPVVLFTTFASSLALFSAQVLIPKSAQAGNALRFRIVRTRTEAAMTERTFIELIPKTTFYVREKKSDGELRGIMAAVEEWPEGFTWQNRQVVFARSGRFVHDPVKLTNELWLFNGSMVNEDRITLREDFINFETCRIRLDIGRTRLKDDQRRQQLDLAGMKNAIDELERNQNKTDKQVEDLKKTIIQWHERMAFPLGCLALCFWALPLGIQPPRAGRSRPIMVSVILSAVFYYLMILAKFAALKGWTEPGVAIWAPNLIILVTGLYMLRQKNNERPIFLLSRFEDQLYHLSDLIKEYLEKRRKG